MTLRADRKTEESDYSISVILEQNFEGENIALIMLSDRYGESLYEREITLNADVGRNRQLVFDNIVSIIAPAGIISRNISQRVPMTARNDFECYILSENSRAKGLLTSDVVDFCITEFSDSNFYPFFLGRKLWMDIQGMTARGLIVDEHSTVWKQLGQAINHYPQNPYLNIIAAKVLTGSGQCSKAKPFANRALQGGKSFPAIEMALIIETYGCSDSQSLEPYRSQRIAQLVEANPIPDDLLKLYMLLGLLVSEQEPTDELMALNDFDHLSDSSFEKLNSLLTDALIGDLSDEDRAELKRLLPTVVFSNEVRQQLLEQT